MKHAESVSQSRVKQNLVHYTDGEWRIRKTWVLFDSGKLKDCCQFETFAKLGDDREGGCCACAKSFHIMCQFEKLAKFSSLQIVQFCVFMTIINLFNQSLFLLHK